MKKTVLSLVALMMISTGIYAKGNAKVEAEQPRQEITADNNVTDNNTVVGEKNKKGKKKGKKNIKKPVIKKDQVTISMQTLRF